MSQSEGGTGVCGEALSGAGTGYGLHDLSNPYTGHGVYGVTTGATGYSRGVLGETLSDQGYGVHGKST